MEPGSIHVVQNERTTVVTSFSIEIVSARHGAGSMPSLVWIYRKFSVKSFISLISSIA